MLFKFINYNPGKEAVIKTIMKEDLPKFSGIPVKNVRLALIYLFLISKTDEEFKTAKDTTNRSIKDKSLGHVFLHIDNYTSVGKDKVRKQFQNSIPDYRADCLPRYEDVTSTEWDLFFLLDGKLREFLFEASDDMRDYLKCYNRNDCYTYADLILKGLPDFSNIIIAYAVEECELDNIEDLRMFMFNTMANRLIDFTYIELPLMLPQIKLKETEDVSF